MDLTTILAIITALCAIVSAGVVWHRHVSGRDDRLAIRIETDDPRFRFAPKARTIHSETRPPPANSTGRAENAGISDAEFLSDDYLIDLGTRLNMSFKEGDEVKLESRDKDDGV